MLMTSEVVAEKVVAGGETADDDEVFSAFFGNGSRDFLQC